MTIQVQLSPGIHLAVFDSSVQAEIYRVELADGRQFQVNEKLYHVLDSLHTPKSLPDLAEEFQRRTGQIIASDQLEKLLSEQLQPQGLVVQAGVLDQPPPMVQPASPNAASILSLHYTYPLFSARTLAPIIAPLRFLFNLPLAVVLLLLVIGAHGIAYTRLGFPPEFQPEAVSLSLLYVLLMGSGFIHEFGHLTACQRWQCPHGPLGIGFYFFFPVFYVDITPAWRLPRWQRTVVDVGGMYFHLLFTLPLVAAFLSTGNITYLWAIILIDINILVNFNPFIKLDGYCLLSDIAGVPNLHKRTGETVQAGLSWLLERSGWRKAQKAASPFRQWGRIAKTMVLGYAALSILVWPLVIVLIIPALVRAVISYPHLWLNTMVGLSEAIRVQNLGLAIKQLLDLLVPTLIIFNIGILIKRIFKYLLDTIATRRNIMGDNKLRWILLGSGLGFIMAILAAAVVFWSVGGASSLPFSGALPDDGLKAGQIAPDFTTKDVQGNTIKLAGYKGKPVILQFWSPGCPPCRDEIPAVQKIYQNLDPNVVFLTVTIHTSPAEINAFLREHPVTFPILMDESNTLATLYNVHAIPFTYFINGNGSIQKTMIGTDVTLNKLDTEIQAWLKNCEGSDRCGVVD